MYRYLYCILLISLLAGCTLQQQKEESPQKVMASPEKKLVTSKSSGTPSEIAILVSSDIPAYRQVADALAAKLGPRSRSWYLPGDSEEKERMLIEIAHSQRPQVVAIGLDASITSKKLRGRQVVFCQVFNYEEHKLSSPSFKGVSMLPSFGKSFAAWKAISPNLKQVAIITGPGLREYVLKAKEAARIYGITLLHKEVDSDMELMVAHKNVADKVQGYWLWPDNRVLSSVVIRDVLTFSMRSGKQVVVFNDELLGLGGMMSVTSDYNDIASNVIERLEKAEGKKSIPGAVIQPLDTAKLRINAFMVKRFGLTVPNQYRKYLDAL